MNNEQPGTAPKLTPEHIAEQVVAVQYQRFPGTTVTVCCITLRNGYNTIGHSACVSPENFDAAIGEQIAYKNALNEIWQLEGYLLAEWLHMERCAQEAPVPAVHGHAAFAAAPALATMVAGGDPVIGFGNVVHGSGVPGDAWPVGANIHGIGPDVANGPNSNYVPDDYGSDRAQATGMVFEIGAGDFAGAGASGEWESKTYDDGTTASGPAPLPESSPSTDNG
jgi:hypothetical protein